MGRRLLLACGTAAGLAVLAGGCGGGKGTASCTIYDRSSKLYVVFRAPGTAQEAHQACTSFARHFSRAGVTLSLTAGKQDYSADVRMCSIHGRNGEMDVYDSRSAGFGKFFCQLVKP